MSALIELGAVSTAYGQSQILWDVDLAIDQGSVRAVIGRNGVGKTTLLSAIMGNMPLTGGSIRFAGEEIGHLPAHRRARMGIGFVPQGRRIFPHLTVRENLETGLSALGGRQTGPVRVPDHIFDLFPKLSQILHRRGGLLSGGEQQQLAIARALTGQPRLLLLDEPTEGIQPNIVQQIERALRKVRDELGMTILVVEQYLDFVWAFADGYTALDRGRVIRQGDTRSESAAEAAHLVHI